MASNGEHEDEKRVILEGTLNGIIFNKLQDHPN